VFQEIVRGRSDGVPLKRGKRAGNFLTKDGCRFLYLVNPFVSSLRNTISIPLPEVYGRTRYYGCGLGHKTYYLLILRHVLELAHAEGKSGPLLESTPIR
ncbi:hypothetical protein J6590_058852, partial [Homalodisca vitripennis]